jgi:hypothetical protein
MKFRFVFWDVLPCKIIVDRRFRGTCCLHHRPHQGIYEESAWIASLDISSIVYSNKSLHSVMNQYFLYVMLFVVKIDHRDKKFSFVYLSIMV